MTRRARRMEQEKCGRGRPKIDAGITEVGAPSRRQAINAMYMPITSSVTLF